LSRSTVESTTRRAAPWGTESGEARREAEPELYTGVHAEMIEQKQAKVVAISAKSSSRERAGASERE
jgi:hypothetical protein